MENNPPTSFPPAPDPMEDKLWISREEYERLKRSAEIAPTTARPELTTPIGQGPVVYAVPAEGNNDGMKVLVAAVAGIAVLLAFTTEIFSFLAAPLILLFFVFGLVSIIPMLRKSHATGTNLKMNGALKIVLFTLLVLLALPVLGYIAMIAFFIFLLTIGGGDVGS